MSVDLVTFIFLEKRKLRRWVFFRENNFPDNDSARVAFSVVKFLQCDTLHFREKC